MDKRRKAGAKPRNIDVSLDKSPVAENSGRAIEKPIIKQLTEYTIQICSVYDARVNYIY